MKKLCLGILLLLLIPLVHAQNANYEGFAQRVTRHYSYSRDEWEMTVDVDTFIDIDDIEYEGGITYEIMVEIESDGERIFGKYLQSEENACSNATIEGTLDGDEMNWVVTYSGDCCPHAEMEFTGTISFSGNTVEGEMTPISDVPENCWLWFADVTLVRQ